MPLRTHSTRRRRTFAGVAVAAAVGATIVSATYVAHGAALDRVRGIQTTGPTRPPMGEAPEGTGDVSRLEPALRHAFVTARRDARAQGVELHITSGWRSHAEQAALFADAVRKYGSPAAASHWVLPPGQSAHERGAAIDVGPPEGAAWLEAHGVHYGLCRRYANESWHFELLAPALWQQCPALEPFA